MGTLSLIDSMISSATAPEMPVLKYPGETLFARANPSHSIARDLPSARALVRICDIYDGCQLTKVNECCFAGIVDGLATRNVHNVAGHARRGDEASALKAVQLGPINRRPLQLLPAKMPASSMRAIHDAVGVDLHEVMVSADISVDKCLVAPRNARVRNENVQTSAKLANGSFHRLINCVE